jgi:hypothetical protein
MNEYKWEASENYSDISLSAIPRHMRARTRRRAKKGGVTLIKLIADTTDYTVEVAIIRAEKRGKEH